MSDFPFKTTPLAHQLEDFESHKDDRAFGLFWEPGLGKSKEILDVASHLHASGRIDALLIVASKAVYKNWLSQEIPPHLVAPFVGMSYDTAGSKSEAGRIKQLYMLAKDLMPEWVGRLRVVVMSYNSIAVTDRGLKFATDFCTMFRTMIVADESTAMASGKTKTAKRMKMVAALCHYKWIATGTPVAAGPFAIHSQVEFLEPDFWRNRGLRSLEAFRQAFGIFVQKRIGGGRVINDCVGYRGLDRLYAMIAPITSRRLKEDCLDLPPKIYVTRSFEMTRTQRLTYESLRSRFYAELDSGLYLEAPLAITRLIRLQQITSGHAMVEETLTAGGERIRKLLEDESEDVDLPLGDALEEQGVRFNSAQEYDAAIDAARRDLEARGRLEEVMLNHPEADPDLVAEARPSDDVLITTTNRRVVDVMPLSENPRLQLLLALLEEYGALRSVETRKAIVWCRFKRDVEIVCEALGEWVGGGDGRCVRYDGSTKMRDRELALKLFREPGGPSVFVANTHAISQGVTLTIAKTAIYFSNSESLERRLQSEDRPHRIGQTDSVVIVDLVAEGTVDEKLIKSLRAKYDIAAQVTGDRFREWITPYERGGDTLLANEESEDDDETE